MITDLVLVRRKQWDSEDEPVRWPRSASRRQRATVHASTDGKENESVKTEQHVFDDDLGQRARCHRGQGRDSHAEQENGERRKELRRGAERESEACLALVLRAHHVEHATYLADERTR